jgi:hypothetical protein
MNMAFLALEVRFQLGAGRRALADLGLGEEEVDDLVLVSGARSWAAAIGSCWTYWMNVSRSAGWYCAAAWPISGSSPAG